jgi:hypothetical protein
MTRDKLEKIYNKHINAYLSKNRMARFEDIPTRIFIDAMEQALHIHDVVGQSEQFNCYTCKWLKRTDGYCDTCFKFKKHEPAT